MFSQQKKPHGGRSISSPLISSQDFLPFSNHFPEILPLRTFPPPYESTSTFTPSQVDYYSAGSDHIDDTDFGIKKAVNLFEDQSRGNTDLQERFNLSLSQKGNTPRVPSEITFSQIYQVV